MSEPNLLPVEPSCVGRDAELSRIEALRERAATEGRGHVVLVTGPAGVGKSAFVTELSRRLRAAGVLVAEGRCRPAAPPFQAIADLADALLERLAERCADAATLARFGELCAALRGRGERPPGAAGVRRQQLFDGVRELVVAAGARPLAVVLHDLHHADDATRALFDYLARTLAPPAALPAPGFAGLVIATSRAEHPVPADVAATAIPLPALDREGVRAFLLRTPALDRLLVASGGVPRRLEELLGRPVPDAATLAAERLAALSPAARHLAAQLALYDRPAGGRLLARLATREALVELGESPVAERQVCGGELQLFLPRPEDREGALEGVDAAARATLHRELGAALAALGDADPAEVAEHLLRGGAGEPAVDAALAAGARLERAAAFERAAALYEQALAATTRTEVRAELAGRLAALYQQIGDYQRALDHARAELARDPADAAGHAAVGHLHLLRGELAQAREALARAQALASQQGARAVMARALADGAEAHFLAGAYDRALADGRAALAVAEAPELAAVRVAARNTIGKVGLMHGDLDAADACFAANLADARRASLYQEAARALVNLGIVAIRRGDNDGAEARYRAGLEAADASGDLRHRAFCLQNLGVLAQWRRDYREALRCYQDAVQAFTRLGHRPNLAWVALDLGDLYLNLGAVDHAQSMVELCARLVPAPAPTLASIQAHLAGRIAIERGHLAAAREHLERALELAHTAQSPDETALALLSLARLELREEEPEAALAHLGALPEPARPRIRVAAAQVRAEAALLGGDAAGVRAALAVADAHLTALGDEEAELRAALLLARAAAEGGEPRVARRQRERARLLDAALRARVPEAFAASYGRDPLRADLAQGGLAPAGAPTAPRGTARVTTELASAPARVWQGIVGGHPRLIQVLDMVQRVAPSDSLVLLRGESGTGKELVAEAIHTMSRRAARPFVKVNCGALVDTLLLSELFGHERGAFTGALARKKGRFEVADGGTLFLDEIGDISPQTQVALLRVLQTREFERVGGTEPIRVDVRIVCATNRDLEGMVQRGQFREDLYYRLQGLEIALPALRERPSDVAVLARHFLERVAAEQGGAPRRLTRAAEERLAAYPWPGNVRELENVMRSISLFCDGDVIDGDDLADYLQAPAGGAPARALAGAADAGVEPGLSDIYERAQSLGLSLKELKREIERQCITRALAEAGGNITRAAELLRMKRPRLSQLLKEHGIVPRPHLTEVA